MLRSRSKGEINVYKESNRPICTIKLHICFKVRICEPESKFTLLILYEMKNGEGTMASQQKLKVD
jgi:hypothetical protein